MVRACVQRPTAKVLARRTLPKACGGKCVKPKVTPTAADIVRSQLQYGSNITHRPLDLLADGAVC